MTTGDKILIAGVFCLVVLIAGIGLIRERTKISDVEKCLDDGYELYIDGREVDSDHVSIEAYPAGSITIRNDLHEVHIAK